MLIEGSVGDRLQFLQFYLAVTVLIILPAAVELTRRRELYRALVESEARYRLLTENSSDIILNLDVTGIVRFASPSLKTVGGYDPSEVLGRPAIDLVDPRDADVVRRVHARALANPDKTFVVEYRAMVQGGPVRWFETHARAVNDGDRTIGVVSAIRDVTHRKSLEAQLSHAAATDPLTGLANRRTFDAALQDAIAHSGEEGGCVAVFDLDLFKRVNDVHGHAAGDEVLKSFARVAEVHTRAHDLVARLGGEEFAIIMPGASVDQALQLCERLRQSVAEQIIQSSSGPISVTVSGGISAYAAGANFASVMGSADAALYVAKSHGRDRLETACASHHGPDPATAAIQHSIRARAA